MPVAASWPPAGTAWLLSRPPPHNGTCSLGTARLLRVAVEEDHEDGACGGHGVRPQGEPRVPKHGVSQLSGDNLVSQSVVVAQKEAEQDQAISHCGGAPGRREVAREEIDRVNTTETGSKYTGEKPSIGGGRGFRGPRPQVTPPNPKKEG